MDARLADAHELVKQLPGPFDFVFSDADKGWYLQYFKDVDPKLEVGGCFTAHNVLRSGGGGAGLFLDYVKKLPNYRTTVETGSGEGISVSCKTAADGADASISIGRRRAAPWSLARTGLDLAVSRFLGNPPRISSVLPVERSRNTREDRPSGR